MTASLESQRIVRQMQAIQKIFFNKFGVDDIWSNSKVFEIVIASALDHDLIPGHSGSSDATDASGAIYEYKHFKELSSNHSWTFNDFSEKTIQKLNDTIDYVFFCHINDNPGVSPPLFDWYYRVPGAQVSSYLKRITPNIKNARKMINLSSRQLETNLEFPGIKREAVIPAGRYATELSGIFSIVNELELLVGVSNVLTSSKFWEVIVALELGHFVNSEQGGRAGAHDARDLAGSWYEYKISKSSSWNFQDISPAVLKKYGELEKFILATVDKKNIEVKEILAVEQEIMVSFLQQKLERKKQLYAQQGKELRRLQVSVTRREVLRLGAEVIELNVSHS